jgi:hypothetical protein
MSLHDYTLYALVRKDTYDPAYKTHQDDEMTPIEACDLEALISIISDWMDVPESTVLESLNDGEITGDDGEIYKIVRLKIETWDLDPDDESEIKRMME